MAQQAIFRVWYGKRVGIPRSFKDIGNFHAAAKFATLMIADRIEVIREPQSPAAAMGRRTMATEQPPPSL